MKIINFNFHTLSLKKLNYYFKCNWASILFSSHYILHSCRISWRYIDNKKQWVSYNDCSCNFLSPFKTLLYELCQKNMNLILFVCLSTKKEATCNLDHFFLTTEDISNFIRVVLSNYILS